MDRWDCIQMEITMNLAERTKWIDSSGIRKVFALVADMDDPVNLSIGQPNFDVSEPVKEAAIQAIRDGKNSYTLTGGLPELCERVRAGYTDLAIESPKTMITSGVSGGILLSFMAVLNPGDEVIISDPYFVMYKHLANFIGAKPVYVDTYPDFQLTPERLEAAITPQTKLILLNSPTNPSGAVTNASNLKAIAEIAIKHDLLVLTDEIYNFFTYDGTYQSFAPYYPQTILLGGFSKSAAMTGWRVGFAIAPEQIINAMLNIQMYTFVCAPSMAQWAALAALDDDLSDRVKSYREKRDLIYNGLKDRFEVTKPEGAFYIFPKAPGGDGDKFVMEAIKNQLLIVPGSVFSERKSHFRISYAAENSTIERGLDILNRLADQFSDSQAAL